MVCGQRRADRRCSFGPGASQGSGLPQGPDPGPCPARGGGSVSKRSKRRRSLGPRRKRLRRPARLEAARRWIASGARVTPKTYARWFGTDRYTAYQELQMLGVQLRPEDARWAVRPPPVPRRPPPAPNPPPSYGSVWVEVEEILILPVAYAEGGCSFGPTLDDLEPEEREAVLAERCSEARRERTILGPNESKGSSAAQD